jgi:hypothetical protein
MSVALCLSPGMEISFAQYQNDTYAETRKLLLQLERDSSNKALKKLFEKGDERMADLIRALYDTEEKINLNSQVIIKYLAAPKGLDAVEEWYTYRKSRGKGYWAPKIDMLSEPRILDGKDGDPAGLTLKNLHPGKDTHAKVIAYNRKT